MATTRGSSTKQPATRGTSKAATSKAKAAPAPPGAALPGAGRKVTTTQTSEKAEKSVKKDRGTQASSAAASKKAMPVRAAAAAKARAPARNAITAGAGAAKARATGAAKSSAASAAHEESARGKAGATPKSAARKTAAPHKAAAGSTSAAHKRTVSTAKGEVQARKASPAGSPASPARTAKRAQPAEAVPPAKDRKAAAASRARATSPAASPPEVGRSATARAEASNGHGVMAAAGTKKSSRNKAATGSAAGPQVTGADSGKSATGSAQGGTAVAARETAPPHATTNGPGLLSRRQRPVERRTEGYTDERWLTHQRHALSTERSTYLEQARALRAEAESLVEEMEPGDVQFDDESGEGGTVTVDRERDLALSAQALQAVEEIDHAVAKISSRTYGICENCGRLIPKPRLEALPFARLCIDCKSGGLSRR